MEMTMGHLYERLLEALGPRKVSNIEKKRTGNRGLDFVHQTASELRLINLKAGRTTANADISDATTRNLIAAKDHRLSQSGQRDDNPLQQQSREVVMIRAFAKGRPNRSVTKDGIVALTGDSLWSYFGAGERLLSRLQKAMGRNPIDYDRYNEALEDVQERLVRLMRREGFVTEGHSINWNLLVERFP